MKHADMGTFLNHYLSKRITADTQAIAERDIQLQLSGVKFSDQVKTTLKRSPERTPQHNRLIESVLSLPGSSLEEEARQRSAAINAIIAYCYVMEGETPRVQHKRSSTSHVLSVSVYSEKRPTVCWVCLGNKRALIGQRIQSFYTPGDLSKHFKKIHLVRVKEGHRFGCDLCKVALDNEMH
ncbi:hypothetical protein K469DRAFT_743610 [Zopfia rhizophila CBS 207.26]|uniref:Uncharacterized protein n=1 Tax=Zopfia rhizophila CBS 207.26 TaxID=1314779 RepID=A0A6A6D932_9PEZI|nr:hypothetical protein K469DRAFT_743610 [Zopfia rhizophila CBS 207.26]